MPVPVTAKSSVVILAVLNDATLIVSELTVTKFPSANFLLVVPTNPVSVVSGYIDPCNSMSLIATLVDAVILIVDPVILLVFIFPDSVLLTASTKGVLSSPNTLPLMSPVAFTRLGAIKSEPFIFILPPVNPTSPTTWISYPPSPAVLSPNTALSVFKEVASAVPVSVPVILLPSKLSKYPFPNLALTLPIAPSPSVAGAKVLPSDNSISALKVTGSVEVVNCMPAPSIKPGLSANVIL